MKEGHCSFHQGRDQMSMNMIMVHKSDDSDNKYDNGDGKHDEDDVNERR